MIALVLVVRVLLAVVFAVAAIAKLRDPHGAQRTVAGFGVPTPWRSSVAFTVSVVELGAAALLVLPGLRVVGAVAAVTLLTVFLVGLGAQYLRGIEVPCACFGQMASTPAGLATLLRNAVLLAGAVFVALGHT